MSKIQLIYNPSAGNKRFAAALDKMLQISQESGRILDIYRSDCKSGIRNFLDVFDPQGYDMLAVAGGDGTVNEVVSCMMRNHIDLPLGIIPAGTANDFAACLKIPRKAIPCFELFVSGAQVRRVDLGGVNGSFFINVCSAGILTDVSHTVDTSLKNNMGMLAYYMKGIEQIQSYRAVPVRIISDQEVFEGKIALFLVFNGCLAGGFKFLNNSGAPDDGMLDLIALHDAPLHELSGLFIKMLQGKHLNDAKIYHIKSKRFSIECTDPRNRFGEAGIDGESGPAFPLKIEALPGALGVFCGP